MGVWRMVVSMISVLAEQGVGQLFTLIYVQTLSAEFASRFEILGSLNNDHFSGPVI